MCEGEGVCVCVKRRVFVSVTVHIRKRLISPVTV